VNGKREGKAIVYHPGTKQPASITIYKNGVEEGEYVEYYLDGQLKMKVNYIAGNMEGTAIWYFTDGKINILGAYQHAVKHGKWTYYNADGTVKGTETWAFGKLTSQEQLIKSEDLYKTIENPQDPKHDANPGGGGGGN
jgi:antitoxin component YwqK of YwqJK toxin-antitoxin module